MSLGFSDLENIWIQAGGPPSAAPTMAAIAMAESGGRPEALNPGTPTVPEHSVGLWQINLDAHPQYSEADMYDPMKNAQAAVAVSNNGTNFYPWSTFTNGAYKQYMSGAASAVSAPSGLGSLATTSGGSISAATTADCQTFKVTLFGNDICFDPFIGVLAIAGGSVLLLAGLAVLVAFTLKETGLGRAATKAVGYVPNPVGAAVRVASERSEAKASAAKATEDTQRQQAAQTHQDAIRRSQLRISRARARVAEGRARGGKPTADVAASASRKAASGRFSDFNESEVNWAEKNPDALRAAIKGADIKA